jgi:hypothetical protein
MPSYIKELIKYHNMYTRKLGVLFCRWNLHVLSKSNLVALYNGLTEVGEVAFKSPKSDQKIIVVV